MFATVLLVASLSLGAYTVWLSAKMWYKQAGLRVPDQDGKRLMPKEPLIVSPVDNSCATFVVNPNSAHS